MVIFCLCCSPCSPILIIESCGPGQFPFSCFMLLAWFQAFSGVGSPELSQPFPCRFKVYPVGIPVLYAVILWKNRKLLNPRIHFDSDGADEGSTRADPAGGDGTLATLSRGQAKRRHSHLELQELAKRVKERRANPKLAPSMVLWKDFGESWTVIWLSLIHI